MLVNLAHITDMRHNWQLKLSCHQTHRHELADACQSRAISLDIMHAATEEIVLEHDPVGDVLAGGYAYWRDGPSKPCMSVDVVRVRRLFNPKRSKRGQGPAPAHRFERIPTLIGVKH